MKPLAALTGAVLLLGLTSCVSPSTAPAVVTVQIDADKALLVADSAYHVAVAAAIALPPGPLKDSAKVAGAKAAVALHDAYRVRTGLAVSTAISAIALFSNMTGTH